MGVVKFESSLGNGPIFGQTSSSARPFPFHMRSRFQTPPVVHRPFFDLGGRQALIHVISGRLGGSPPRQHMSDSISRDYNKSLVVLPPEY